MFYRQYCKKKTFLAPISLFHFFLNCKINPKAVVNSHTFVVVCSFATVVHQTQHVSNFTLEHLLGIRLKQSHPYRILTQCNRIPFFGYTFAFQRRDSKCPRLTVTYVSPFCNRPAFMFTKFSEKKKSHWCHTYN